MTEQTLQYQNITDISVSNDNICMFEKVKKIYNHLTDSKFFQKSTTCVQLLETITYDLYNKQDSIKSSYTDYINAISLLEDEFDSLSEIINYILSIVSNILDEEYQNDTEDENYFVLFRNKLMKQQEYIEKYRKTLYDINAIITNN